MSLRSVTSSAISICLHCSWAYSRCHVLQLVATIQSVHKGYLGYGMIRVGIGHDTHRLAEGRPLILGGIAIEHPRGLAGHSDADVVLHALTDALLGAAGLGDIGDYFPDTDPAYAGCDSRRFVVDTLGRLTRLRCQITNIDVIIFAQEPKLGNIKASIRRNLADLLGLDCDRINVKAKTGEKVGAIGRAEAISCQVAALIEMPAKERAPT
jgi:2-C-methyl-D-erythritol 2,4-cyclodiphosphate synthase